MRNSKAPATITYIQPLAHTTKRKRVKTYKVRAHHDGCGGELIGTERGVAYGATDPWSHRCEKCGAVGIVRGANYPVIVYEE